VTELSSSSCCSVFVTVLGFVAGAVKAARTQHLDEWGWAAGVRPAG